MILTAPVTVLPVPTGFTADRTAQLVWGTVLANVSAYWTAFDLSQNL